MAGRTIPFAKRGFNFETTMWLFTRFTVIAMYGLILLGVIGGLMMSAKTGANLADIFYWAFFPNKTGNVIGAYIGATILAKLMVTAFVLVVCGHGVHGVLEIWDDYVTNEGARRWARNIVITYAIVASIIAVYVILSA